MSDVIGPNSYLPGNVLPSSGVKFCDNHSERQAVKAIVGETDSMGSEILHVCQECLDTIKAYVSEPSACDWCKTITQLTSRRDPDEGSSGRVYLVCSGCIKEQNKRAQEELEDY